MNYLWPAHALPTRACLLPEVWNLLDVAPPSFVSHWLENGILRQAIVIDTGMIVRTRLDGNRPNWTTAFMKYRWKNISNTDNLVSGWMGNWPRFLNSKRVWTGQTSMHGARRSVWEWCPWYNLDEKVFFSKFVYHVQALHCTPNIIPQCMQLGVLCTLRSVKKAMNERFKAKIFLSRVTCRIHSGSLSSKRNKGLWWNEPSLWQLSLETFTTGLIKMTDLLGEIYCDSVCVCCKCMSDSGASARVSYTPQVCLVHYLEAVNLRL